jgi:SAM-dependent methyltransferase
MVFDGIRNAAYFRALAAAVNPHSRVLDLGAGVGVLGLEAARLGACKVYLVDPSAAVHAAVALARDNMLEERVDVIQARVEAFDPGEKVDIILSVFTGNFLLEEDLLPLLFRTRDRLLAPGGALIPDRARMYVAPASLPDYYAHNIDCWGPAQNGIDFSAGREYAVNTSYSDSAKKYDARMLGDAVCLAELDFTTAADAQCKATVEMGFREGGVCHGFLGWFDMRLGQEWLSTSPLAPATHWRQLFFPFRQPLAVQLGDTASLRVQRPQHGQWSWIIKFGAQTQAHSTAMASPLAPQVLAGRSEFAQPLLGERGRALSLALQSMDGRMRLGTIVASIMTQYPNAFTSSSEAMEAVASLAQQLDNS